MIDFTERPGDKVGRPVPAKYEVKQDYKIKLIKSNMTLYKVVQVGTGKTIIDSLSRKGARNYRDFLNGKVIHA